MFRTMLNGRFYVCIVRETKDDPLLTAVEVRPYQVVDILYEKGHDPEAAWSKLELVAAGENIALGTEDIRRFRNLDFDADARRAITPLMPQIYNISVIKAELALSVCNRKRLRQLEKVSKSHLRQLENALDGIIKFRRTGKTGNRFMQYLRRVKKLFSEPNY